jgi:hypothetical protein
MRVALRQSLRIVATPKAVERLCSAKRTMCVLEAKSVWNDIEEARYKRARRIVKRGLG